MLNEAKTFFSRPEVEKNQIRANKVHRGFLPIGEATMSGARHEDFKESFVWGWEVATDDPDIASSRGILAPNCWPDFQPDMAPVLGRYIETINGLGICLLRAFAAGLGLKHDHFTRSFSKPLTRAAIIHYPPQPEDMGRQHFGVSPRLLSPRAPAFEVSPDPHWSPIRQSTALLTGKEMHKSQPMCIEHLSCYDCF